MREKAKQLVRTQHFKLYSDGRFFDTRADLKEKNPLAITTLQGESLEAFRSLQRHLKPHTDATQKADPVQNQRRAELKRAPVKKTSSEKKTNKPGGSQQNKSEKTKKKAKAQDAAKQQSVTPKS